MRRLPPSKRETARSLLADIPENCSSLFLLNLETSVVMVDDEHTPKFLSVTYPSTPPAMYFIYAQPNQVFMLKHFLKLLKNPTDIVIPQNFVSAIKHYWSVKFSIPILMLAAEKGVWKPEVSKDPHIRLLNRDDAKALKESFATEDWLWDFFFTPEELLSRGGAAAAFIDGEMACVVTTIAYTEKYCELGVATRPEYRGRGLALECSRTLSAIQFEEFGRLPCWRTQTGNIGSWKVAKRLGLEETTYSEKFVFLSNYKHVGAYAGVAP